MSETSTAAGDAPPSDEQIATHRANKARADNLAKARDAKAAKAAASKAKEGEEKSPEKPERKSLEDGTRLAVRLFWMLSGLGARVAGGKLEALTPEEVNEGTQELLPVVRRWPVIASILAWVGFPFWLVRLIGSKFRENPPEQEKTPEQSGSAANVHQLRGQA